MESINSMEGKLFYLVHQMAERKMITMKDKGILKGKTPKNVDLIIGSNDEIINAYESYLKDGTELTLTSALLHSLVNGKENDNQSGESQDSRKVKIRRISVQIPKRSIQKLPEGLERL